MRLEALWRSWEHLRLDPATGMSVWLRDHADHYLPILFSDYGPSGRSSDESALGDPLPYEPPPPGLFPSERLRWAKSTRTLKEATRLTGRPVDRGRRRRRTARGAGTQSATRPRSTSASPGRRRRCVFQRFTPERTRARRRARPHPNRLGRSGPPPSPDTVDLFALAAARLAERVASRPGISRDGQLSHRRGLPVSGSAGAYPVQSEQGCGYHIVLVLMWPSHSHFMRHHPPAPRPDCHDCQRCPNHPPSPGRPPLRVRVSLSLSLLIHFGDGLLSDR